MVTIDEVNYLVYQYLVESGFAHTSFVFEKECIFSDDLMKEDVVPCGALVSLLRKGMKYTEIETHLNEDGTQVECKTPFSIFKLHVCDSRAEVEKKEVDPSLGHVFSCKWNPFSTGILASASSEGVPIIWNLTHFTGQDSTIGKISLSPKDPGQQPISSRAINWDSSGRLLAVGSSSGLIYVWGSTGKIAHQLRRHKGDVTAVDWCKSGSYLLSGGLDTKVILWDANMGDCRQVFEFGTKPILGITWKNNSVFAVYPQGTVIYIGRVGDKVPVKTFTGHSDDITDARWDPLSNYLASSSEDKTVRLWDIGDAEKCIQNFEGHEMAVKCIDWGPIGMYTNKLLASGSRDATVRIWEVETGKCLNTLSHHRDSVNKIVYSRDGRFLAIGSSDKTVSIWSVRDGVLAKCFGTSGGVYELAWNGAGNELAIGMGNRSIQVVDVRL